MAHSWWRYAALSGVMVAGCSQDAGSPPAAISDLRDTGSPDIGGNDTGGNVSGAFVPPAVRAQIDLDTSWRFLESDASGAQAPGFDDSSWLGATVPHTWNAKDGEDGGNNYYRGIGWYRRHYTPPASLAGKKLWLDFAGVNTVADVWVNGVHLGQHKGGYARFRFDATSALKIGADNVIAVKVSNAADPNVPPLSADYTFFGGIYRDVRLDVTDPLSIRLLDEGGPGVYVRQRSVGTSSATLDITSKDWNNSAQTRHLKTRAIVSDGGTVVADVTTATRTLAAATGDQVTQTVTIANPHLWAGRADPHLYDATVEVIDADTGAVTDALTQRIGLRSFALGASTGFSLNGGHLGLHGVNRHQDRLDKGWAIGDAEHTQDFDLMDEMGVNALRTAHYQQDQKVYDLADERGYVVWAEIPMVNAITAGADFQANAEQQLRELVRQNYNHPSIVFWGVGNEQAKDDTATNALLQDLANLVNTEDPDRISTYAHNGGNSSGLITHSKTAGFNKYYGWYSGVMTDFGPWADGLHSSQTTRTIAVSEYGAGASVIQHQENPPKPTPASNFHPEEYQALLHESHWNQISARPFLWGTFLWNMFDFASDGRNEGDTAGRNDKGLVTYDRATRKDAFYWYKANWTNTPFVYITSRRWTHRTNATTTIKVYGSVDSARLTVNGVDHGAVTSNQHVYSWPNVTLSSGANVVTVTGSRGGQTLTDSVTWTLSP